MAEKGNPDVRFPVTDLFSYCYFDVAAFPSSAPTGLVPRRPLHLSRWSLGGTSCRMVFCELSAELHVNAGGQLQAYIHFCSRLQNFAVKSDCSISSGLLKCCNLIGLQPENFAAEQKWVAIAIGLQTDLPLYVEVGALPN